jgi:Tfp pilus assembly protein PilN
MRRHTSLIGTIANRVGSIRWRTGGARYFDLELGTRHRGYVAPARLLLLWAAIGLGIWIAVSGAETLFALHDLHELQARLDQARQLDQQLMNEAREEGFDLSEAALRQLPSEVALANQLLAKRNFSWTQFLSGLEEVIPARVSIKGVRLDPVSSVIHMTGAAGSVEDVTALTLKLQSHPVFHDPVLGQHHLGGDGLVEFDLKLKYRPQGA